MKKLLILSGKGGTGKTSTAASFIYFLQAQAIADCDVDAPNLHLVLDTQNYSPEKIKTHEFLGSDKAGIDTKKCINCGNCADYCRFEAIKKEENFHTINTIKCEGCGLCTLVCPAQAVSMKKDIAGEQRIYQNKQNTFSTAKLKMGRGNSGKLVTAVKKSLFETNPQAKLAIIDGSPGIGCPVMASINGINLVLIVAEPSSSGFSDLVRLVKTIRNFQVPAYVCINKWDTNPDYSNRIKTYCKQEQISFMGTIPYDETVSKAINQNICVAEFDCPASQALYDIYINVMTQLRQIL